jgi:hypothetical protein
MAELLIAAVFASLVVVLSIWADRRFRAHDRLPMQWSFAGTVNWTAPRRMALAFTPAITVLVLGGTAITILLVGVTRPGQEHLGVPVLLLVGGGLLAAHLLHLWLIERSVR